MTSLVFFLEERSAAEMIKGLLPRLLSEGFSCQCIVFEGKQDLEKQLPRKLRGWKTPDTRFIVMRDQDQADCKAVKQKLHAICKKAGKHDVVVCIACRELESWYLADLKAVEAGLEMTNLLRLQNKGKYRNPDEIVRPCQELKKITHNTYKKIRGSRMIGPYLALDNKRSASFNHFVSGIRKVAER